MITFCILAIAVADCVDYPTIKTDYKNVNTVVLVGEKTNTSLIFKDVSHVQHIQPNMPQDMAGDMYYKFKSNGEWVTVQSGLANHVIENDTFYIIWQDYYYEGGMFMYGGF